MPSWNRLLYSLTDIYTQLLDAVYEDTAEKGVVKTPSAANVRRIYA